MEESLRLPFVSAMLLEWTAAVHSNSHSNAAGFRRALRDTASDKPTPSQLDIRDTEGFHAAPIATIGANFSNFSPTHAA